MHNEVSFEVKKSDEDKRLVFGWASVAIDKSGVPIEDLQGDLIEPSELETAAYDYVLNFRDTGEEHIPDLRKRGRLVESCVFTKEKQEAIGIPENTVPEGWWIGFYIDDEDAWQKIKSGEYTMFSVEGKAVREPVEAVEKKVGLTFLEVMKYNKNHDSLGRFASGNSTGGGSENNLNNSGKRVDNSGSGGKIKSSPKWNSNPHTRPAQGKVKLPSGEYTDFVKDTKITRVRVFAGKGSSKELRVAKFLSKQYGGDASGWSHPRGEGFVIRNGKPIKAEIHWFEHDDIGMVQKKVKRVMK